jgi:hypothetical protein
MSSNPILGANPFLSQWLSAANSATGTWRGFWTAEFARQQAEMMTEFNRQALRFWAGLAQAPSAAAVPMPEAATAAVEAVAAPAVPDEADVTKAAEAAEDAAEPIVARRARAPKPAPLRAAAQRRKAAKRPATKRPAAKSQRATRH